jgi:hypothetical protein
MRLTRIDWLVHKVSIYWEKKKKSLRVCELLRDTATRRAMRLQRTDTQRRVTHYTGASIPIVMTKLYLALRDIRLRHTRSEVMRAQHKHELTVR